MNKEKLTFVLAIVVLAIAAQRFVLTQPAALQVGQAVTRRAAPSQVSDSIEQAASHQQDDMSRPSPFYAFEPQSPDQNLGQRDKGRGNVSLVPPITVEERATTLAVSQPRLGYVGVAHTARGSAGLLRKPDGTLMRVREGEIIDDLGITVRRLESQGIVVTGQDGKIIPIAK